MFGIGMSELFLILAVALIVVGPKKMPEIARLLGRGFSEFRKASQTLREAIDVQSEKAGFKGAFSDIKDTVADAVSEVPKPGHEPSPSAFVQPTGGPEPDETAGTDEKNHGQ